MDNTRNLSEYTFGQLLSYLLTTSHQKSYVLASFLNYDVSYISKWVTGSMLPAAKHANSMCKEIATFIVDNTDDTTLNDLFILYPVGNKESLKDAIYQSLLTAYQLSGEIKRKSKSILISDENNSRTVANPHLQKLYMRFNPDSITNSLEKFNLAMMMDLFALGKEDKVSIAKTDANANFIKHINEVHYLVSLNQELIDDTFDALLITYLLNNYADLNFTMSHYKQVPCSLMLAIPNYYMHMSIVSQNHRAIISNTCQDKGVVNEMYDTILSIEQCFTKPMIRSASLPDLIQDKHYLSFVISSNIRLYLTKMDELLLPDDVFEELLESIDAKKNNIEEIKLLHNMFKSAMNSSNIKVAILDHCLQNYALTGTIDFYGNPLTTTIDQRERHLNYLMQIMKAENPSLQIYLTNQSSLKDFDNNFAPCMYLSDIFCYIRLRSCTKKNRTYVIEANELKEIYLRFVNTVFDNIDPKDNSSLVRLSTYLNMIRLLKS